MLQDTIDKAARQAIQDMREPEYEDDGMTDSEKRKRLLKTGRTASAEELVKAGGEYLGFIIDPEVKKPVRRRDSLGYDVTIEKPRPERRREYVKAPYPRLGPDGVGVFEIVNGAEPRFIGYELSETLTARLTRPKGKR